MAVARRSLLEVRKKSRKVGPGAPKIDPKSPKIDQKSLPEGTGHRASGNGQKPPRNGQRASGIGLVARGSRPEGPARGCPKSPRPGSRILKQIYIYIYIYISCWVVLFWGEGGWLARRTKPHNQIMSILVCLVILRYFLTLHVHFVVEYVLKLASVAHSGSAY